MRRYSFGTFLVDDSNRALYETCRAIATLSYRGRLPVMLVAPEGYGKTHLLYSIVNRARSGPARTGVAFVSADEFPAEVRRLTRNPGPVERARNAILLVDDLHRFHDHLDDLDRLVDLFLKHGHYVVLSSALPLAALEQLPAPLRRRLERGNEYEVETTAETGRNPESRPVPPASDQPGLDALQRQCEATQNELAEAKREIEQLRADNALLKVSAREVGPLRERLEALQDRLDHPEPEPPRPEVSPARQQAGAVLEKAAALLEEVQQSRTRLARMREQSRLFESGDAANEAQASAETRPAPVQMDPTLAEITAERDQLRQEREGLERELGNLRRSVARANEERDETRRHLRAAYEKLDRYERNLAELRGQVEQYSKERDHLAEQQSTLHIDSARSDAATVSEGLRDVQAQFAAGLRLIDRMADRLDALCTTLGGEAAAPPSEAEAEPFFVTPTEQEAPAVEERIQEETPQEPSFVPGIGARALVAEQPEPSQARRTDGGWTPRRSLHHIEELAEPGLFGYPEDYDSSI